MKELKMKNLLVISFLAAASLAMAADKPGYKDTPLVPGTSWHVHDPDRPQPRVVTPGDASKAPSDAIVLFDGTDLSKWRTGNKDAGWKVENGAMVCVPKSGSIRTREEFTDMQIHLEFATPTPAQGHSQERGNSGLLIFGRFEVQILDSYNNPTYADGGAAALYGQYPPLVNVSRPPGEWQVYDVVFTAPRFKEGKLDQPAYVTVFHNGVLVQNHSALHGPTNHRSIEKYTPGSVKGPLVLQDHGNTTKFRNIWVRPLKSEDGK
jgi:hypothetical protein